MSQRPRDLREGRRALGLCDPRQPLPLFEPQTTHLLKEDSEPKGFGASCLRLCCLMPLQPGTPTGVLLAPCRPGVGSGPLLLAVPLCYPRSPSSHQQGHRGEMPPQAVSTCWLPAFIYADKHHPALAGETSTNLRPPMMPVWAPCSFAMRLFRNPPLALLDTSKWGWQGSGWHRVVSGGQERKEEGSGAREPIMVHLTQI